MTDKSNARDVIDMTIAGMRPDSLSPGDLVSVIVPSGAEHRIVDLEQYRDTPSRKRGRVTLFTAESFARYTNSHAEPGALYADVDQSTIVAVLNGHVDHADMPGWGDHRATFTVRKTREWKAWTAIDGTFMDQAQFAEFLEDHAAEVVNPSAADLLELAKTFEATTSAEFSSAIRLNDGSRQFLYSETIAAKAGQQGRLTIPDTVELGLAPFEGADPWKLIARFRYRIGGGHLKLGVVLDRPAVIMQTAFEAVVETIEAATTITAFRGLAPA